ncbi:proline iminopeptidase-like [Quillaja saponaria]|uniref:Proline iminopeptidase-like n=1 Tax=Quillaja saponaria TaxID=32244 RepID=A0AAD7L430_QUISA|nr:proline iminopeptidase-like [Quillaja saponaria]
MENHPPPPPDLNQHHHPATSNLIEPPIFSNPLGIHLVPPIMDRFTGSLSPFHTFRRRSFLWAVSALLGANFDTGESSKEHVAGNWFSVPELGLRDHRFTVPLDYSLDHSTSKISIFAREVVVVGKEKQPLPYLLYLEGGPGFECLRPTEASGWIHKACDDFHVILMDQRGTGLSTPLTVSSISQLKSADNLADYLKHFRADNIVNDAEFIRVRLVPDAGPWTVLGQSYGGFCAVTYLSFAPNGLKQVLLTGGIPPIGDSCPDTAYKACLKQITQQNEKYYKSYPQDIKIVQEIVNYLAEKEGGGVSLPSGGFLTPRGLQTLGLTGLGSGSGFAHLHYMFDRVWDPILVPGASKQINYYFLNSGASSRWSAHRIMVEDEGDFDAIRAAREGRPVHFTGEMIYPWMFDEFHALKQFKDVAHILAEKKDWPPLYDVAVTSCINTHINISLQHHLIAIWQCHYNKQSEVPVAAAVYYEDMYVNFKLSMETASQIAGIRLWVTNEFMHSGLRDAGTQVFEHLLGMLNGKKPLF